MVNLAAYIRFSAFEWYTPALFWKAFRFGQMSSSTSAATPSNITSGINIREQQDAFDLYECYYFLNCIIFYIVLFDFSIIIQTASFFRFLLFE